MKLRLHETCELHTEMPPEEAKKTLRSAMQVQFSGKESEDGFLLSHKDRNPFRPALFVRLLPDAEGTLLWTDLRMDKGMLLFLCLWTVLVIVLAAVRGWMLLVMLVVFWGIGIIGFRKGVKAAKETLLELFEAYEIL